MDAFYEQAQGRPLVSTAVLLTLAYVTYTVAQWIRNLYLHPLSKFPGPKFAAASDSWHMWEEIVLNKNYVDVLESLHKRYGEVVRVGPNELSFSNPHAYNDIYNNQNRWDKEYRLYHSFGEDRSSFGFLTYAEAKERKDAMNTRFSPKATYSAEGLVRDKINALVKAFTRCSQTAKSADLNYAYRCLTMDVVTYLSFGKSVDAIEEPGFKAPIIVAMDASMDVFNMFKHFDWYKNMIMNCPPKLSKILSPPTAGLVDLQQILGKQIAELTDDPGRLNLLPHNLTIYHQLLSPEAHKSGVVPVAGSLYEEAQALMFGGADTVGNTLMVGTFHMLKNKPETYRKLKAELKSAWPSLEGPEPSIRILEQLPYLNAVIKESLRMNMGVVGNLLRIVPSGGATISGVAVPEGTIVGCGIKFVHYDPKIFPEPYEFTPERWLENPGLDKWMVSFSRGPRSCMGINLAWMELRMTLATVIRQFDLELVSPTPNKLTFKEAFLPNWNSGHVYAKLKPESS